MLSLSDVTESLRIIRWIVDNGWQYSANTEYIDFRNDVRSLESALRTLDGNLRKGISVDTLLRHLDTGSQNSSPNDYIWDPPELGEDMLKIIGGFYGTLKDSELFLKKQSRVAKSSNVGQNVIFALDAKNQLATLRERIQFHLSKVNLVMGTVQLQQSGNIQLDVSMNLDLALQLVVQSLKDHPIPDSLAKVFCTSLYSDSPPDFCGAETMDLEHGFNAMLWNFRHSTTVVAETHVMGIEQILNLRKAQFVFQSLRQSCHFLHAGTGSPWRRQILKVGHDIKQEFDRDLPQPLEADLVTAAVAHPRIWMPRVEPHIEEPIDAEDNANKLLELDLVSIPGFESHKIMFFQRDTTIIRKLEEKTLNGNPWYDGTNINTLYDGLVARYAMGQSGKASHIVELQDVYERGGGKTYELRSLEDALSFQRVFTGYQTDYDKVDISWSIKTRWNLLQGRDARVQIWRWKPYPAAFAVQSGGTFTDEHSSQSSPSGDSDNATLENIVRGIHRSSFSTTGPGSDGNILLAGQRLVHPRLMIYTKIDKKWVVFCTDLNKNHRRVPEACSCLRHKDTCRKTVVENKAKDSNRRSFKVKKRVDQVLNLGAFASSLEPTEVPNSNHQPGVGHNHRTIEKFAAKHIELEFRSVKDKNDFNAALDQALRFRNLDEAHLRRLRGGFGGRAGTV